MKGNIALYLVLAGVALNTLDLITSKAGTGGAVFGSNGFLSGANNALPQVKVPGTEVVINIGGWLVIAGAITYAVQRWL